MGGYNMEFKEYMQKWFNEYIEQHEEKKGFYKELFQELEFEDEMLSEDESYEDFILCLDDMDIVYKKLFVDTNTLPDIPDTQEFLTEMFTETWSSSTFDFTTEFIEDMAYQSSNYDNPKGFFMDLATGGCQSGMVGGLIYTNDCKQTYINHIDSLEEYVEYLEDEIGEPIRNTQKLPRYVFVCWLCYEELGHNIGRTLFPEDI